MAIRQFIQSESAGGVMLAAAALLALLVSNSSLAPWYEAFVYLPGEVRIGEDWLVLSKPLVNWVNDLWMAVFFFLVGLEIKRELVDGELASLRQAILPAGAALGGMLVPALIYVATNYGDDIALRGWAIPAATDIAFALAILMVLGSRVPVSLKLFLTAVAIIDDLGAIVVIAIFYTDNLSLPMLISSGIGCAILIVMNRARVMSISPYLAIGVLIWLCVLKSGVHATLAGVITALAIPASRPDGSSPLQEAEHVLQPWVAFAVLPMFAFANAGVSLQGVSLASFLEPVSLGIALGLTAGKAIGVFGTAWLLVRSGAACFPADASRRQFFAVCVLCGIGFTMSLFIGSLAFEGLGPDYEKQLKIGVLAGSILSAAIATALLLKRA
ncbi:MAG: Na+/H+ antiporter NhaA [Gammaproteobacteria bacterium]|nr:Na+/H+ antiporter NhaA [Gammaproteobacteria bacterium]